MQKILLSLLLVCTLWAKETLYLHMPSSMPTTTVNTAFGKELLQLIKNSKKKIQFCIYGLRDQDQILTALKQAQKRGVKIQGVVDSDARGKNYYTHTKLLYKYFDIVTDKRSAIMHNKFFIFDNQTVWTGSSNISNTGTGGYNSNNAIIINDKIIAKIYTNEFNQMFKNKRFQKKKKKLTRKNIQTKDSIISIYFSPKSNTYQEGIKELIQNAEAYIYIPIFYLTHKPLRYDLIQAHKRGVKIKIILDASAARNKYSIHQDLRDQGIEVKVENFGGKMHTKSIIVDDQYIVTGSMNLTKAGNKSNDENTLIIKNTKLALQYKKYFLDLWKTIPKKYLHANPSAESLESINSCSDGIDNDFDKKIDGDDYYCHYK